MKPNRTKRLGWTIAIFWTMVVGISFVWNYFHEQSSVRLSATVSARAQFEKDIIYRRWNAGHGGVYVPISESSPSNPYLTGVEERDIESPSGRKLTLVNPAYMTRQVHQLGLESQGVRAHITSLKPIRPANAPDDWEKQALENFTGGNQEYSSIETMDGETYLRFMGPLITEKSCLKCHAKQGYSEGEIRGGISVSVPLAPYMAISRKKVAAVGIGHLALWLFGLGGIGTGIFKIVHDEKEREALIHEQKKMLSEVKTLRGFLPICSYCKKIRDDEGYWNQIELYISNHSEAEFSHSLCPDCFKVEMKRINAALPLKDPSEFKKKGENERQFKI